MQKSQNDLTEFIGVLQQHQYGCSDSGCPCSVEDEALSENLQDILATANLLKPGEKGGG